MLYLIAIILKRTNHDSEVFLKAAEHLNLNPRECFAKEEVIAGIDAGNSDGFITIGIGPARKYKKIKISTNKLSDLLTLFKE